MIPYQESKGPMGKHRTGSVQIPHDTTQNFNCYLIVLLCKNEMIKYVVQLIKMCLKET